MERNTLTTIADLDIGDRFYRAGDKSKMVFEKLSPGLERAGKMRVLWAGFADHPTLTYDAKQAAVMRLKSNMQVIFLRHKTEK